MPHKQRDTFLQSDAIQAETGDLCKAIRTILELMQEPELRRPRRPRERGSRAAI